MQWPAFPSETDPRFQEMLSKALAVPGNASAGDANSRPPAVEGTPVRQASDSPIDLEACRRTVHDAREWLRRNRHRWAGPAAAVTAALENAPSDAMGKPHASDAPIDLEACKRAVHDAREWLRRNRHKWAGPAAAAALAVASTKARTKAIRSQFANARFRFAARRHRVARRRPLHRARFVSRTGPRDDPAPDEPNAPAAHQPPPVSRAGTARLPSGAAALHKHAHVGAFTAEQAEGVKATPPRSATSTRRVTESDARSLARRGAREVPSRGSAPPLTFAVYLDRWPRYSATDPCRRSISCAQQGEAEPTPLVRRAVGQRMVLVLPLREPRERSAVESWGPAAPTKLEELDASGAVPCRAAKIAPPAACAEIAPLPAPPRACALHRRARQHEPLCRRQSTPLAACSPSPKPSTDAATTRSRCEASRPLDDRTALATLPTFVFGEEGIADVLAFQ